VDGRRLCYPPAVGDPQPGRLDLRSSLVLADRPVFPTLFSIDLAASRAFYHDRLGLPILHEDEERILFRCGGRCFAGDGP
jgi:hypothetical protein